VLHRRIGTQTALPRQLIALFVDISMSCGATPKCRSATAGPGFVGLAAGELYCATPIQ
jgi:hypothetical protein